MTPQEIFDKVAVHLLTQNRVSMNEKNDLCAYRGVDGLKCAVGVLIPDEFYSPEIETTGAENLPEWVWKAMDIDQTEGNVELLDRLQRTHDDFGPESWVADLKKVAEDFNLNDIVVNTFCEDHGVS
jgi:hypothetical protein